MARLDERQIETLRQAPLGTSVNRLRIAFALANVSRTHASTVTGIPTPTISKLIAGTYSNADIELRIAEFFGCELPDLFPGSSSARLDSDAASEAVTAVTPSSSNSEVRP